MVKARIYKAKASDKKIADLHIYGDIDSFDFWGDGSVVSLKIVRDEINALGGADAFDELIAKGRKYL